MSQVETIKKNKDFQICYKKGKKYVFPGFISYVLKGKSRYSTKIGITSSKKIGNAVIRNRARRVIKESYRLSIKDISIKPGYRIVFVCKSKTPSLKSTDVMIFMQKHLKDIGVIEN